MPILVRTRPGLMAVDDVVGQGRAACIGGDDLTVWHQTQLDQSLEAVADTAHQTVAVLEQLHHRLGDCRVAEEGSDELCPSHPAHRRRRSRPGWRRSGTLTDLLRRRRLADSSICCGGYSCGPRRSRPLRPAWSKALAASYSQLVPGNTGISTRGLANLFAGSVSRMPPSQSQLPEQPPWGWAWWYADRRCWRVCLPAAAAYPAGPPMFSADPDGSQSPRWCGPAARQRRHSSPGRTHMQDSAVQRSKDTVHIGALFQGKADAVAQSDILRDAPRPDAAGTHCPTALTAVPSAMQAPGHVVQHAYAGILVNQADRFRRYSGASR